MSVAYRELEAEDVEQGAYVEAVAFYNDPSPERTEQLRQIFPPQWTLGAFVDGRVVAVVRTVPMARRINGKGIRYGTLGPVACLAEHRRQGHVGKLLRLSLERMQKQGMPLSGLHTPHDALYRHFGWERAEGKKQYIFRAKDLQFRHSGTPGTLEAVPADEWQRLEEVYRRYASQRNGALHRPEPWWRNAVLRDFIGNRDRQALVWLDAQGEAQGFIVHVAQPVTRPTKGQEYELVVYDIVALTSDAYLGLWQHLLTHDIARPIMVNAPLSDPLPDLVSDPWRIEVRRAEGAMVRVVDLEHALAMRPYCGTDPASLTMRVTDSTAPWNEGVWRIEAQEGRLEVERSEGEPEIELDANFLAPLYTGFVTPETAATTGMIRVHREEALEQAAKIFAVTYPPYCADFY